MANLYYQPVNVSRFARPRRETWKMKAQYRATCDWYTMGLRIRGKKHRCVIARHFNRIFYDLVRLCAEIRKNTDAR